MRIDYSAAIDIGPKETNDDRILVDGAVLDAAFLSGTIETPATVAVCDGCGGYAGGGIAADTVLEFLSYEHAGDLSDVNYLSRVLQNCENMIQEKKAEIPRYKEMCTTIAGCVFCEDSVVIFHSGDSRVYRNDRWGIARMTRDHSIVQDMVDSGQITPEEARSNPRRNVINRCLGINGPLPEIYVSHTPIMPGEKYLLCSDGLWESVSDAEIQEILNADLPLPQMAEALLNRALAQGADDNISICICSVEGLACKEEQKAFVLD